AQALRPEDGIGSAVAQAHHGGAPVPQRLVAKAGERIGEIGFARLDFREARLRALLRAIVVARERPRDRAPEQLGCPRDRAAAIAPREANSSAIARTSTFTPCTAEAITIAGTFARAPGVTR